MCKLIIMQVFCFTFLAKALVAGGMQLKDSIGSVDIIYGISLVGDILLQNQLFICSGLHSMITVCNVHTLGNYSGSIYPQKIKFQGTCILMYSHISYQLFWNNCDFWPIFMQCVYGKNFILAILHNTSH